jgi:hypothetical protein
MNSARTIILFLMVLLIPAAAAKGVEVRVDWPAVENATEPMPRSAAIDTGFNKAVHLTALDLLPGSLALERSKLLYSYLEPRAGEYVLSYSEEGVVHDPARTLVMNVDVNRQALKDTLKRIGVYYTVDEFRNFDLRLSGGAQAFWEELGRLTTLSGLTVEDGSQPRLHLSLTDNATLMGTLSAGDKEWIAYSNNLEGLWADLWGQWFTLPEAEEGLFQAAVLTVSGWYSPEGVRAFVQKISGWERELESAVLTEVEMLPDGIKAKWLVRYRDERALEERLSSYLYDRGLGFEFEDVPSEKKEESAGDESPVEDELPDEEEFPAGDRENEKTNPESA